MEDPNWLLLKGVQASNLLQKVQPPFRWLLRSRSALPLRSIIKPLNS
ncbi:hypothetical protein MmTuc01_1490 [Methanosarcina mazei Tuc01]|uniref:Uncharacterized protein n=1 Tax=Methanosarcina mazei Tuc01 TaxID=1236903 RepID=M1QIS0_METMZ|nr:hypothetical protein MmTuc01_1490 [Methanosarcina mazei Tuc01]